MSRQSFLEEVEGQKNKTISRIEIVLFFWYTSPMSELRSNFSQNIPEPKEELTEEEKALLQAKAERAEGVSIETIERILQGGRGFLDKKLWEQGFDQTLSKEDAALAERPFPKELADFLVEDDVFEKGKKNFETYDLVFIPSTITIPREEPLGSKPREPRRVPFTLESLAYLLRERRALYEKNESDKLIYEERISDMLHSNISTSSGPIPAGYYCVRRNIVPNSTNKTFPEEVAMVPGISLSPYQIAQRLRENPEALTQILEQSNYDIPPILLEMTMLILHAKKNNERLLYEWAYGRTASLVPVYARSRDTARGGLFSMPLSGTQISVGFKEDNLDINRRNRDGNRASSHIGMALLRKFKK